MMIAHKAQLLLVVVLLLFSNLLHGAESAQPHSHESFTTAEGSSSEEEAASVLQPKLRVVLDHDGGIDDFIALLVLLSQPHVDLVAVTICNGDGVAAVAANTTLKILRLFGAGHVPVAVSTLQPVNPFPDEWRWEAARADALPVLNDLTTEQYRDMRRHLVSVPAQRLLEGLLTADPDTDAGLLTVVATGPLTNLAFAIRGHEHEARRRISAVWWMGGALHVPGNVYGRHVKGDDGSDVLADGSAEWNAFSDPRAMELLWSSAVPMVLTPLDATNQVPITLAHVLSYGPQSRHPFSNLAGTMYSTVLNLDPASEALYYAWDALTAACAVDVSGTLCRLNHSIPTQVLLSGASQGAIQAVPVAAGATLPRPKRQGRGVQVPGLERAEVEDQGRGEGWTGSTLLDGEVSVVKHISAAMHVDQNEFYCFILAAFRH